MEQGKQQQQQPEKSTQLGFGDAAAAWVGGGNIGVAGCRTLPQPGEARLWQHRRSRHSMELVTPSASLAPAVALRGRCTPRRPPVPRR